MNSWPLTDEKLLRQCRFEAFVGSGPGGQKRHKTNAAVRLTHLATGIQGIASESRSQRENRIHALRRLRHKLAMESTRTEIDLLDFQPPTWMQEYLKQGLRISEKNPLYPQMVVTVLDLLKSAQWEPVRAALSLGISTSALVRFLASDPPLWTKVNGIRGELGMASLVRR
jgi:RF-1 domain